MKNLLMPGMVLAAIAACCLQSFAGETAEEAKERTGKDFTESFHRTKESSLPTLAALGGKNMTAPLTAASKRPSNSSEPPAPAPRQQRRRTDRDTANGLFSLAGGLSVLTGALITVALAASVAPVVVGVTAALAVAAGVGAIAAAFGGVLHL